MSRAARFRVVCHFLSALLLITGLRQLVDPALTAVDPLLGTAQLSCSPCRVDLDPVRLLDRPLWKRAWQDSGIDERIQLKLVQPNVRRLLIGATAALAIPLCVMFVSLSIAVRRFARNGFASRATRWLRLSALSALIWTLMGPVSRSMRAWAMDSTISGAENFRVPIDFYHLISGALIAGMAWAAAWALQEAVEIQRDLDEYV